MLKDHFDPCANIQAADHDALSLKQELTDSNILHYQKIEKITQDHLQYHQNIYQITEIRTKRGIASISEIELIQVYLDKARIKQIQVKSKLETAKFSYPFSEIRNPEKIELLTDISEDKLKNLLDFKLADNQAAYSSIEKKQQLCWNTFQQQSKLKTTWARVVKYSQRLQQRYLKQFYIGQRKISEVLANENKLYEAQIDLEKINLSLTQSQLRLLAHFGKLTIYLDATE